MAQKKDFIHNSNISDAIEEIRTFSFRYKQMRVPLSCAFKLDEERLKEIPLRRRSILSSIVKNLLSPRRRHAQRQHRDQMSQQVQQALEQILRYPLSPGLLDEAAPVIETYNEAITEQRHRSPINAVLHALCHWCGIAFSPKWEVAHLPHVASLTYDYTQSEPHQTRSYRAQQPSKGHSIAVALAKDKILGHQKASNSLEVHEEDLMYMKAISSLKNTPFKTNSKWTVDLPAQVSLEIGVGNTISSTVTLGQKFEPLPGEVITLQGRFKRQGTTMISSLLDSFRVSAQSNQLGFPHPLQHTGWALTNSLFPQPHYLSHIPAFRALYQDKYKIAHGLLPQGYLNEKAKQLLKLKEEVFQRNIESFILQHTALAKAILHADSRPEQGSIIHAFFESVKNHTKPYRYISAIYRKINTIFIDIPLAKLEKEWIENGDSLLHSQESKHRFQACVQMWDTFVKESIIDEEDEVVREYIKLLGPSLSQAGRALILQKLSEKLLFAPPLLSTFERMIQACIVKQLAAFSYELNLPESDLSLMQQQMSAELQSDIELFQPHIFEVVMNNPPYTILTELENYYYLRHKNS